MAVSSNFFNVVTITNDKMQRLKSFIKESSILNAYNKMLNRWSIFKSSLNRHDDESALPILQDFNAQFNAYYSSVMKKKKEQGRAETRTEIPDSPHGKAAGAVTIAILIGGVAALLAIGKSFSK